MVTGTWLVVGSITFQFLVCVVGVVFETLLYLVLFVPDDYHTQMHARIHTHTEFLKCNSFVSDNIVFICGAFFMLAISYLMASNVSSNALRPNSCVLG